MKLLLDTHTLLWSLGFERQLPPDIRRMVERGANRVYFSAANLLEVATKRAAGPKRRLKTDTPTIFEAATLAGYEFLAIEARHAIALETIAPFHGDPVDRLLLAQAQTDDMRLVTRDERLAAYDSRIILF